MHPRGWFRWRWVLAALACVLMILASIIVLSFVGGLTHDNSAIVGILLGVIWGFPVGQCLILARNERPGGPWDFGGR